jgi:CRP-like cAMP-binding protein
MADTILATSTLATSTRNNLLRALPPDDAALVEQHLEPVQMERRFVLERPQVPIEHVYFPDSGIASMVAQAGRDRRVEAGIFGRDGMSGIAVVMGDDRSSLQCFMQVGGEGQRIASEALRDAMEASPGLRLFLLRFVHALMAQTTQTVLADAQARLEERLCRWLLMCHDRINGDVLPLTHDFLATMLGVRRAGVTMAVHVLEGRGLIRAERGSIMINDREGLEIGAGGTYGVAEAEYQRLMGINASGSR